MNPACNGSVTQGQQLSSAAALQQHWQFQQQLLYAAAGQHQATGFPAAAAAAAAAGVKAGAPLQMIQQHYGGSYDASGARQQVPLGAHAGKAFIMGGAGPAASNAAVLAAQQQDLHTADQHHRAAANQQPALLDAAPPAVTGHANLAQQQPPATAAGPQAQLAAAAVAKQEPGSPVAHSPTSSVPQPAAGPGSATPEASAPPPEGQPAKPAAAAGAGGRYKLAAPSKLAPPDVSEGPAAAVEYQRYLQRWEEGQTLAQRWHRLSAKGVLGDIVEEWEEWQHDLLLRELQAHNKALARQARKHRRDEPEVDMDAPRQTRTRRVPMALQDYQVEAVTAGTPEPPNIAASNGPDTLTAGPTAVTGVRAMGVGGRGAAQQLHSAALEDTVLNYADPAAAAAAPAGGDGTGAAYASRAATKAAAGAASNHVQAPARSNRAAAHAATAAAAAAAPKGGLVYNKAAPAASQQQYVQQQYGGHAYQQHHQQQGGRIAAAPATNGYALAAAQQQQKAQPQQQQRMDGYGTPHSAAQQAPMAAANRWPPQQQQQLYQQQYQGGQQQQQQQTNGYHLGAMGVATPQDLMSQLLHMGSAMANNHATAPPVAGVPVSLPQGVVSAEGLPQGLDYNAAFQAFTQVLGRVDPVAFTQHFTQAMAQQQRGQHH